jgi:GT2 family glycosyltransferase
MADTTNGLLNIGIQTFNGGFNFEELFFSIKNLGLEEYEYEILVVDNASTDDTPALLENLKERYSNLRYYLNDKNIGRTENWDKVVRLAKGEYLILMNVNDRFLSFDVRKYIRYLDRNTNISMLLADINIVYPESAHLFPNFKECGVINLSDYLVKTFLDPKYME